MRDGVAVVTAQRFHLDGIKFSISCRFIRCIANFEGSTGD